MTEVQNAQTKKGILLTDLSRVPVASTKQLSQRYSNNSSPLKKVSQHLVELEKEKLVQWDYWKREKVWKLTRKARQLMNTSQMRYKSLEHALSIAQVYFTLQPTNWLYEPTERFKYGDKEMCWSPDCVLSHNKKVYAIEVQLTPLSKKSWEKKFNAWNIYFREEFKKAQYQSWSTSGKTIMPNFVVISKQGNVEGLNVPGRQLQIISNIAEM